MLIYKKRKNLNDIYLQCNSDKLFFFFFFVIKGSDILRVLDVIFWEIYSEDCKLWASSNDSKNNECNFFLIRITPNTE